MTPQQAARDVALDLVQDSTQVLLSIQLGRPDVALDAAARLWDAITDPDLYTIIRGGAEHEASTRPAHELPDADDDDDA